MEKTRLRGHRRRARSRLAHTAPRRPLRYRRLHSLLPGLRGFSRAARASYPARVPTPRGRPGLVPPVLVSLFVSVPRRSSAPRGRGRERALRVPARARCGLPSTSESAPQVATWAQPPGAQQAHTISDTTAPKTQTTSPTTAHCQRYSPRRSALWAPHPSDSDTNRGNCTT